MEYVQRCREARSKKYTPFGLCLPPTYYYDADDHDDDDDDDDDKLEEIDAKNHSICAIRRRANGNRYIEANISAILVSCNNIL